MLSLGIFKTEMNPDGSEKHKVRGVTKGYMQPDQGNLRTRWQATDSQSALAMGCGLATGYGLAIGYGLGVGYGLTIDLPDVCNLLFHIPLYAVRRVMAAAPPRPKQRL